LICPTDDRDINFRGLTPAPIRPGRTWTGDGDRLEKQVAIVGDTIERVLARGFNVGGSHGGWNFVGVAD
jgi:hypothetical protein